MPESTGKKNPPYFDANEGAGFIYSHCLFTSEWKKNSRY